MDELRSVDPNEIELVNANELLILKDEEEVERFKAEKEAIRKAKKPVVKPVEVLPDLTYMERFWNKNGPCSWERVVKEADTLFNNLLQNYDKMLDGDDKVKHFDVLYGRNLYMDAAREIRKTYHYEIQRELVPWIKNEFQTGELFKMENWRLYRDRYAMSTIYLGYRKLIIFKQFLLQLTISFYCDNDVYKCDYCEKEDYYGSAFSVALYGWTDMIHVEPCEQKYAFIRNDPNDLMIPESHWAERD